MFGRALVRILIVLAVLVAAIYGGIIYFRPTAYVASVERDTAVKAAQGTVTVLAKRLFEVRSEVSGRIATSQLELGDVVHADEVLLEIEPTELKLQIERDENDVEVAKRRLEIGPTGNADLLNAKDDLEVKEELFAKGSIAKMDIEHYRRGVDVLEQKVALEQVALQQQLDAASNNLARDQHKLELMTIRSPIDGVVSDVAAGVGDLVNPGFTIGVITSNERIVEVKVSEENFAGVQVGQRATVRFVQYGGWLYRGVVAKILPDADPQTQRYRVHVKLEIEPEKLVAGITGEASITIDERPNALVIPRTALVGDTVFVVKNGRVERRTVEVGYKALNAVEILSGVSEGEKVIAEDLDLFGDGDRVRIADWSAEGGS